MVCEKPECEMLKAMGFDRCPCDYPTPAVKEGFLGGPGDVVNAANSGDHWFICPEGYEVYQYEFREVGDVCCGNAHSRYFGYNRQKAVLLPAEESGRPDRHVSGWHVFRKIKE